MISYILSLQTEQRGFLPLWSKGALHDKHLLFTFYINYPIPEV